MNYFVTVTTQADDAVIEIDGGGRNKQFPLTKRGCLAAGRYLFDAKQESWMCSSSVDFPKEVKPTFRHSVHEVGLVYPSWCQERTRTGEIMNELEAALNEELVKVLGARYNWTGVITGIARRRASKFARSNNGLLEDVVVDVTGDIILQAKEGAFAGAVIRAKEASHTDAELVENLRHVVMKAAFYRVSDAMRFRYGSTQFTQIISISGEENGFAETVQARPDTDADLSEYKDLLVNELEVMATAADWQYDHTGNPSHLGLAKRLRKSKEMVSDRVDGMVMKDLKAKYGGSKALIQDHIDDIRKSLSRVAKRLGDRTLIAGVARGSKWGSKVVS